MRFRNASQHELAFEIAGAHYQVPAGSLVEIEDRWAYCVPSRQLPLVPAEQETGPVVRPRFNVRSGTIRLPDGVELAEAPAEVEDDDSDPDLSSELVPPDVAAALAPRPSAPKKARR